MNSVSSLPGPSFVCQLPFSWFIVRLHFLITQSAMPIAVHPPREKVNLPPPLCTGANWHQKVPDQIPVGWVEYDGGLGGNYRIRNNPLANTPPHKLGTHTHIYSLRVLRNAKIG